MESLPSILKHELHCLLNPLLQTTQNQVKIQKVTPYLRERSEYEKYYFPKVVSIGPIHHPKGEERKKTWASDYLKDKVGQIEDDAKQLLGKIWSQIKELKNLYAEDVVRCFFGDDDLLAWILFVDGCASLHFMHKVGETEPSKLQALDRFVLQDLLLLENQLPYKVLSILSRIDDDDDYALRILINRFIETRGIVGQSQVQINQPAHLLDALITVIVKKEPTITKDIKQSHDDNSPPHKKQKSSRRKKKETKFPSRNIQEIITSSGIEIKKNEENLTSICFAGGTLYIPPFTVDEFTAQTFLNMIAFEMCPDNSNTNYEISNYISFLHSLIDDADDVKALRNAGVLENHLGSDEEVAEIFNTV
ncbi:hypothetical protein QN277_009234 [Acacia crassicarpa]|uniref:Uncharacterized protein n=1 Tax=Acacia crassicarpa TaxID=499986 RepID=A0AAE1IRT6_9FABA|nr:hypothetical protein QN277_009234 [Acacia crassicarpa]